MCRTTNVKFFETRFEKTNIPGHWERNWEGLHHPDIAYRAVKRLENLERLTQVENLEMILDENGDIVIRGWGKSHAYRKLIWFIMFLERDISEYNDRFVIDLYRRINRRW